MAVVSAIDPRLRQRRIAVRRAEGRRRLRVVVFVLVAAAIVAAGYAGTQSAFLDLDTVDVGGATAAQADAVRGAAGLTTGSPMLELDLDAATEAVTSLPWVESATVERSWPGSITIEVVARSAVAVIPAGDGGSILIDASGISISRTNTPPSLPVVAVVATGELGDVQTQVVPLLPLVAVIPDDLLPWIETVRHRSADKGGGLELDLVGSAVADLGDARFLTEKLDALRALLASVDLTCVSEFDVRVADLATARRDLECLGEVDPLAQATTDS